MGLLELGAGCGRRRTVYRFSSALPQRVGRTSSRSIRRPTRSRCTRPTGSSAGPGTVQTRRLRPGASRCSATCGPTGTARRPSAQKPAARATSTSSHPASGRSSPRIRPPGSACTSRAELDPPGAGVVPRFVVLRRGALPVRLQPALRPSVLRRRRHVRLHQRRVDGRPWWRSPAPAGQGAHRRQGRRHDSRAAISICRLTGNELPSHSCRLCRRRPRPLRRQCQRHGSDHEGQVQLHLLGRRQHHLRLPGAHSHGSADRPRAGQHLRDRRLQPRRPPDGVELPAHPLPGSRPTSRPAAGSAGTGPVPAARSATAAVPPPPPPRRAGA